MTEQNTACIQGLLADADIPALVAGSLPDATAEQADALFGLVFGLAVCVPEAMGSGSAASSGQDESRLWSYATGDVVVSVPTVADGVVYVGSNDNHLYALDADTGEKLWSYDTGAGCGTRPPSAAVWSIRSD